VSEGEKVRQFHLILEFRGGKLMFCTEEAGKKEHQFSLEVIRIEQAQGVSCLVFGHGASQYLVSCDFHSERMILAARLLNRPVEGFSLSGEYKRVMEPH